MCIYIYIIVGIHAPRCQCPTVWNPKIVIIQVTLCGYPVPGKNSITHEMSNTFPCRHLLSGYVTFEAWNLCK